MRVGSMLEWPIPPVRFDRSELLPARVPHASHFPHSAETVGKVLQASSDDYVDYYEGYFPARDPWTPPTQSWRGHSSEIELTRLS